MYPLKPEALTAKNNGSSDVNLAKANSYADFERGRLLKMKQYSS